MSDTPNTDRHESVPDDVGQTWVDSDFARSLERHLAASIGREQGKQMVIEQLEAKLAEAEKDARELVKRLRESESWWGKQAAVSYSSQSPYEAARAIEELAKRRQAAEDELAVIKAKLAEANERIAAALDALDSNNDARARSILNHAAIDAAKSPKP